MKFSELAIGDTFSTGSYPNMVLTKTKRHKGSCCTPSYNTQYQDPDGPTQTHLVDDDIEVEIVALSEQVKAQIEASEEKQRLQLEKKIKREEAAQTVETQIDEEAHKKTTQQGGGSWGDGKCGKK